MRTVTFFRLCSRAPWTTSASVWLIGASLYRGEQTFGNRPSGGSGASPDPPLPRSCAGSLRVRSRRCRRLGGLRGRSAVVAACRLRRLRLAPDLTARVLDGVDVDVRPTQLDRSQLPVRDGRR